MTQDEGERKEREGSLGRVKRKRRCVGLYEVTLCFVLLCNRSRYQMAISLKTIHVYPVLYQARGIL